MRKTLRRNPGDNIVAVLVAPDGRVKGRYFGRNIVTTFGDKWYAEAAAGTAVPSVGSIAGANLGSSAVAPQKSDTNVGSIIASGSVAASAGYPKTDDADADNTGAGANVVSWLFSFGTAIANANGIQEIAISTSLGTAGTASLMRGTMASFNKTANDTLKVFVNHTFTGV